MKMNPEVKAKWVEALRSGEYRQTKGYLHRNGGGFCCLGVLCDVAVKDGLDIRTEVSRMYVGHRGYTSYAGETLTLPEPVAEWAGIVTEKPDEGTLSDPVVGGQSLSTWNDEDNAKLHEIADLIEDHL